MPETTDGALQAVMTRRSESHLADPAPTQEDLAQILQAATTVPDHGHLQPWRLVVVSGDARGAFGDALAAVARRHDRRLDDRKAAKIRSKAFEAPMLVALAARIREKRGVPPWEQVASAACTGYVMTLAAHELGLGAIWKTSPFLDGKEMRKVLDLRRADVPLGWVNLGRHVKPARSRARADLGAVVRVLGVDGTPRPYET
jgi:nitroreductase